MFLTFYFFEVSFELFHGFGCYFVILIFCYQAQAYQAQVLASVFVDNAVVDSHGVVRWRTKTSASTGHECYL